jgi:colanic acid/amylovoran biosynthesis protein
MNVLFINAVCSNSGDAAIFQGAAAVIRRAWGADVQIVVQDDHPQRVEKLYPELAVRSSCYWTLAWTERTGWRGALARRLRFGRFAVGRRLVRAGCRALARRLLSPAEFDYVDAYQRADVVVATGGTYLVEHYDLGQRIFDMQTATALGRPLLLYTQSLGPFRLARNRRRLGRVLRAARLILVREQRSAAHGRDLGVDERRLRIAPDAAFALADDDLAGRPAPPAPLARPRPQIAMSVRRWDYFSGASATEGMQRYQNAFAALVAHVVTRYDADVTFLSTCQGAPGYHDDSQVAAAIAGALPDDVRSRVRVDGEFHPPAELLARLRTFDWVVATRMHLAILALCVGAPVLPIAYEFKTAELFKSLGVGPAPLDVETLTGETLIDAFEASVAAYGGTVRDLQQAVDGCRRQAWRIAELLQERFPEFATAAADRHTTNAPHPVPAQELAE